MKAAVFAIILSILSFFPSIGSTNSPEEIFCLSKAMYSEARGESIKGIEAVGSVIVNRKESGHFPASICRVVYQPGQFSGIRARKIIDTNAYTKVYKVAEKVYTNQIVDPTAGATYFHATRITPSWSKKMDYTVTIGAHKFYKS